VEWLAVTAQIYRQVCVKGARLALRNWPVLFTVLVYSWILGFGGALVAPFGMIGGFAMTLLFAACVSSCLSLVETIVRTNKATLEDFRSSFGTYLSDVIGVAFVSWIFFTLVTPLVAQGPQGLLILTCIHIAIFVFFNAVPELIYLGRFGVLQLLGESYSFIAENWIEWFPLTLAFVALWVLLEALAAGLPQAVRACLVGALLYFAMIARGLLFLELHGSSRRGRAFRHRAR
jgi:hypothetical protein